MQQLFDDSIDEAELAKLDLTAPISSTPSVGAEPTPFPSRSTPLDTTSPSWPLPLLPLTLDHPSPPQQFVPPRGRVRPYDLSD